MRHPLFGLAASGFGLPPKGLNQTACSAMPALSAQIAANCAANALNSVDQTTSAKDATEILNSRCNQKCGNAYIALVVETDRCDEKQGGFGEATYTMTLEKDCIKLDNKFCTVDQIEKMVAKRGGAGLAQDDLMNTNNTELCSPCLKYQLDVNWNFMEKTQSSQNITPSMISMMKASYYSLYNSCSNESLNANKDKITFYNGSGTVAASGNKSAAENILTGSKSVIINALLIAGLFLML